MAARERAVAARKRAVAARERTVAARERAVAAREPTVASRGTDRRGRTGSLRRQERPKDLDGIPHIDKPGDERREPQPDDIRPPEVDDHPPLDQRTA